MWFLPLWGMVDEQELRKVLSLYIYFETLSWIAEVTDSCLQGTGKIGVGLIQMSQWTCFSCCHIRIGTCVAKSTNFLKEARNTVLCWWLPIWKMRIANSKYFKTSQNKQNFLWEFSAGRLLVYDLYSQASTEQKSVLWQRRDFYDKAGGWLLMSTVE